MTLCAILAGPPHGSPFSNAERYSGVPMGATPPGTMRHMLGRGSGVAKCQARLATGFAGFPLDDCSELLRQQPDQSRAHAFRSVHGTADAIVFDDQCQLGLMTKDHAHGAGMVIGL